MFPPPLPPLQQTTVFIITLEYNNLANKKNGIFFSFRSNTPISRICSEVVFK